jgi:hypothetical protein
MSSLIHCIYASRAAPGFDEGDLPELLTAARAANATRGISGMLLYVERNFFQVLEGEPDAVDAVFERICRDPRHTRVTRIIHEPIADRDFGDWTMGYASLSIRELAQHAGINDFFTRATCVEQLGPGRAKKLLQAFGRGRWRAGDTGVHRAHGRMA